MRSREALECLWRIKAVPAKLSWSLWVLNLQVTKWGHWKLKKESLIPSGEERDKWHIFRPHKKCKIASFCSSDNSLPSLASRGVDSAVSAVPAPYDLRVGGQHIMSTQRKEGPSLTHSESQKGWPWVGSAAQVRSWLQWKHMMAWPTDMCTWVLDTQRGPLGARLPHPMPGGLSAGVFPEYLAGWRAWESPYQLSVRHCPPSDLMSDQKMWGRILELLTLKLWISALVCQMQTWSKHYVYTNSRNHEASPTIITMGWAWNQEAQRGSVHLNTFH